MSIEDLYYIYRIQYENLLQDLDFMCERLNHGNFSKDKIIKELYGIIRDNCDKTYLLKSKFEREGD